MSNTPLKRLLLTGPPGCGKTTVVRRVVELLGGQLRAGSYTQEIREHGRRVGFEVIGLSGAHAILAHVGFHSRHRVGRYGVALEGFEAIVRTELNPKIQGLCVYVIDEIGRWNV